MCVTINNNQFNILLYDSVDSTNTVLKHLADCGAEDRTVVIAKSQTKGRGRLGRSFYSPDNSGIYMSLLFRRKVPASEAMQLTTSAAVAVMLALKKYADNIKIKWVNDLYLNDKKICGILTESSFLSDGLLDYAVIGIGINLYPPKNGYPNDINNKAGSLFISNVIPLENVASDVLNMLNAVLYDHSCVDVLELYRNNSWLDGRRVLVTGADKSFCATVNGVDEQLRLLVTDDNGAEHCLLSCDVSIVTDEGRV